MLFGWVMFVGCCLVLQASWFCVVVGLLVSFGVYWLRMNCVYFGVLLTMIVLF